MMMRKRPYLWPWLVLLAAAMPVAAAEQEPSKFLRFVETENDGGRLEVAIVRYQNELGATVDLVSAVHVADPAYFRKLNRRFEDYDVVLYEMIKPAGAPVPRSGGGMSDHPIGMVQRLLTVFLELHFQLDAIDYTPPHFVHADLDLETFVRMQRERGESIVSLMLQAMLRELARGSADKTAPEVGLAELMMALQAPDRARQLKLLLGRQFEDMERIVAGLEGPGGSVLLTERNKAALRVLKRELDAGHTNIAVFFGAAHMSDIETRLMKEHGFTRAEAEWVVAWDMSE